MVEKPTRSSSVLRRLSNDEYTAAEYTESQLQALATASDLGVLAAHRLHRPEADYWSSRLGTSAGLLSLNRSSGEHYFDIDDSASIDAEAAEEALSGDELVIDVQTHYMAQRPALVPQNDRLLGVYDRWAPSWWSGLNDLKYYDLHQYFRCVFVESSTAVAVLTAPPPDANGVQFLTNDEMAGTRELIDRFSGTGRLLNHTVIHPTIPGELEKMEDYRNRLHPVGWKVYTLGNAIPGGWAEGSSWMLDDEALGIPFLQRARELGVRNICAHKGLSAQQFDSGSPRDIGPSAKAFPDLRFIVYHSGYEPTLEEVPYSEETAHIGVNRLIKSMLDNGLPPGGNVFAELGSTWFCLIKNPQQAAHVLGKLLRYVGEDNILWGTDGIWYGPSQPVIDAFRAFVIPESMRNEFGYPELTREVKEKILGLNAARVYDLDPKKALAMSVTDDLAWTKAALAEVEKTHKLSE